MDRSKSEKLFVEAKKILVGGTNSPVRTFSKVGGSSLLMSKGEGACIWDVDGNRYVDFVMSYGPHLYGHARKEIVQAVQASMEGSSCLGFSSEGEICWAEKLLSKFPFADKVRAMSSGTEACATAIRLARGITDRSLIVKCSGHYHGHVDSLLVDGGSGLATLSSEPVADSKGIPKELIALSRVIEFNSVEAAEELFAKEGSKIAAFILEPIMGNMGVIPPSQIFLKRMRELCTEFGTLFIADEVMTGLRVSAKSACGRLGIVPDLICLGKIVGGGLPLSALAGPSKWMDFLAPLGPVYQAGTLSGNPISIAAGTAMLDLIENNPPYEQLEEIGAEVEALFYQAAANHSVKINIERVGAMMSVYFREGRVRNASDSREADEKQFAKFFWAMADAGYMLPPSKYEAFFLSTEHKILLEDSKFEKDLEKVFSFLEAQH